MKQKVTRTLSVLAIAAAASMAMPVASHAAVAGSIGSSTATMAAELTTREAGDVHDVQYGGRYRGPYGGPRAYGPGPRVYGPGPRVYGPGPRPFVGPRYYGPARPAWGYRPWYRRPYYGTIIGGIALGSIIGATAYGLAPRPPRPDLCWYWADEVQSRGYWDYC